MIIMKTVQQYKKSTKEPVKKKKVSKILPLRNNGHQYLVTLSQPLFYV